MKDYSFEDSILAIATSLTPQAISLIRASGKDCIKIASKAFSKPQSLISSKGNETHVGWIIDGNKKLDQVVISIYKSPNSFTGEDVVEISCHGGVYVTISVYNLLLRLGFREAERGEFSFRAFLNGKINLTQAEAIRQLTSSKTEQEVQLALSGLSNNLFSVIDEIKNEVLALLAFVDVALEYPEDEIEFENEVFLKKLDDVINKIDELLQRWKVDKLFIEGAKVVIAGRANAGKSSLFNVLLNEERSIVSEIEGTTRDYIDSNLDFNGIPITLYDTAGIRHTKDTIEKIGLMRSFKIMEDASLVLYLIDGKLKDDDVNFFSNLKKPCIVVLTKGDVNPPSKEIYETLKNLKIIDVVNISSKTKMGIAELIEKAYKKLIQVDVVEKTSGAAIISTRQKNLLNRAINELKVVRENRSFNYLDITMQHLQEALSFLGEITGEVRSDDILNTIFSSFCVGK
ncbi:MAG: tRNA uridine-5-carboxymethylaminomethyl(34) synthesis GTPase MnmE [Treponema sp.]